MKKVIIAIAAIGTIATANAQSSVNTGHAHDATTVNMSIQIDNALQLNPASVAPLTQEISLGQLQGGADLTIGSVGFTVWSNREYNVTYTMGGLTTGMGPNSGNLAYADITGDIHDNDDDNTIPVGDIKMTTSSVSNMSGSTPALPGANATIPGYATHAYSDFTQNWSNGNGLNANGGTIFTEARPAGSGVSSPVATLGAFTLNWTLQNPQSSVIGGTYSCNITVTATQE